MGETYGDLRGIKLWIGNVVARQDDWFFIENGEKGFCELEFGHYSPNRKESLRTKEDDGA